MREIDVKKIKDAVTELCLKANFELRKDVLKAIRSATKKETNERARSILKSIVENAGIARSKRLAICQDTGIVSVYLEIGQGVAVVGGDLKSEINEGVKEAYKKGCLRKSVVDDPLIRKNTNTNTPSVIHTEIIEGDKVKLTVSPKGFGSENKSNIRMFRPTASISEIKEFILDVVRQAGPDACPPLILGIGIGGTFAEASHLAAKALLRPIDVRSPKRHIARLEKELMNEINSLGIGPMGLGGKTTVLGVNILEYPTHIAGLPVAVNVSCHATRSAERIL
ncbi:MAG: fumarate hydratase [Candidatus Omnitrophica bacterium]|nr:fumarate hydratase [Candidatus Omnitrophota bacterium]